MVNKITLPGKIGEKEVTVEIVAPNGGGTMYYIMVDNFFNGQIVKWQGEWKVYLNDASTLTPEDCEVILEAVNKE